MVFTDKITLYPQVEQAASSSAANQRQSSVTIVRQLTRQLSCVITGQSFPEQDLRFFSELTDSTASSSMPTQTSSAILSGLVERSVDRVSTEKAGALEQPTIPVIPLVSEHGRLAKLGYTSDEIFKVAFRDLDSAKNNLHYLEVYHHCLNHRGYDRKAILAIALNEQASVKDNLDKIARQPEKRLTLANSSHLFSQTQQLPHQVPSNDVVNVRPNFSSL